jgi:hypothetical protein
MFFLSHHCHCHDKRTELLDSVLSGHVRPAAIHAPRKHYVLISRGTYVLHLEQARLVLYEAVLRFLH